MKAIIHIAIVRSSPELARVQTSLKNIQPYYEARVKSILGNLVYLSVNYEGKFGLLVASSHSDPAVG